MGVVRRIMNELTILDFALGIALLYHWGADGKEIRNFAKRVRNRVEPEYRPLVDLCIASKDRRKFVKQFLINY